VKEVEMTARLFFDPDFGTIVVRDANEPVESHRENLLEITSEQAIALGLSFIGQCLKSIAEATPDQ
jgi:hypothetical protein